MNKFFLIAVIFIAALIAATGCTSTPTTTTPATTTVSGPAGTLVQPTGITAALTTGPVETMPENLAVTVDVGQKEYTGKIPVTFQGGKGQSSTSRVRALLTRVDGTTQEAFIGTSKGDMVELDGTRGTAGLEGQIDRVEVWVSLNNGKTYKIVDVLREYRSRA